MSHDLSFLENLGWPDIQEFDQEERILKSQSIISIESHHHPVTAILRIWTLEIFQSHGWIRHFQQRHLTRLRVIFRGESVCRFWAGITAAYLTFGQSWSMIRSIWGMCLTKKTRYVNDYTAKAALNPNITTEKKRYKHLKTQCYRNSIFDLWL